MTLPSGSRMALLDLCAYWAREDVPADPRHSNTYSLKGDAFHSLVEHDGDVSVPALVTALDALNDNDMGDVQAWLATWKASDWSRVGWRHEVAFAYHVETDTARVLDSSSHRDYSRLEPGEVPATADLVFEAPDRVWVADIKTGAQFGTQPVARHAQLRFLALCAARASMTTAARIVILHMNDELTVTAADLTAADLDAVAGEVRARMARIAGSQPTPGAHCADLYCPALASCPKTTALATRALGDAHAGWSLVAPTSPEHALWMRDGVAVLRDLADKMEAAARKYADDNNGVVNPATGRRWQRTNVDRDVFALDGRAGAEGADLLAELAPGAVKRPTRCTKSDAKAAFGARVGLKGAELDRAFEAQVMVPLRAMGAVVPVSGVRYAEKKDKT